MSSSRMASMRFQSVLDCLFVFFSLFMIGLSERDDADRVVRKFNECYKGNAAPNHPDSNPALLFIVLAIVGVGKESASKHFFRLGEVKPVFSNIWHGSWLRPIQSSL